MQFPINKTAKKTQETETKPKSAAFQFSTVRSERLDNDCYVVTEYVFEFDGTTPSLVSSKVICDKKTRLVALGAVRRFWTDTIGRSMDRGSGFE